MLDLKYSGADRKKTQQKNNKTLNENDVNDWGKFE